MIEPSEDKVVETTAPIIAPSTLPPDAQKLHEDRLFRHFRG
jgi:hypothetical protein